VTQLGFEIRLEVALADGSATWIQVARRTFAELGVGVGDRVYVRLVPTVEVAFADLARERVELPD